MRVVAPNVEASFVAFAQNRAAAAVHPLEAFPP